MISAIVVLVFGGLILAFKLASPRIKELVGADLLSLIGAGACFGAGVVLLLERFIPRDS
jgi:hypothetical protein